MRAFLYNGAFELPDDFSGSLSDALRIVADYQEKAEPNMSPSDVVNLSEDEIDTHNKNVKEKLNNLWYVKHEKGNRHVYSHGFLSVNDGEWVYDS